MTRKTFLWVDRAALVFLALLVVGIVQESQADVFQNPWNSSATDAGAFSQYFQELAGEFVLGSNADVNRATWYGTMFSADPLDIGDTWNFDIRFYSDSGGLPGGLLASESVSATVTDTGIDVTSGVNYESERSYLFDATFTDVTLVNATTYWFSVVNTGTQDTFRWTEATSGLDSAIRFDDAWEDMTSSNRSPLNFTLYDTVPEPTTYALCLTGLLILNWRRAQWNRT